MNDLARNKPISENSTPSPAELPVTLSERAARQVHKIRVDESVSDDQYLRIAVKGGGCSGMSYNLGFDTATSNDHRFHVHDVEVIVDKRHLLYLEGITIDFHDGLDARGFVFNNPNATSTCGCGTSFSA